MRIADIQEFDVNNGEGVGCSLFVQGCHFHCKNCFNQSTWDFNGGKEWTQSTKEKFLELVNRPYITRVSILGGEPLADENIKDVTDLISEIPLDKEVWLYTGYVYENMDSYRKAVSNSVDVLVDGQYVDELRNINLPFKGSSNQRVIDIRETIAEGKTKLWNLKNQSSQE